MAPKRKHKDTELSASELRIRFEKIGEMMDDLEEQLSLLRTKMERVSEKLDSIDILAGVKRKRKDGARTRGRRSVNPESVDGNDDAQRANVGDVASRRRNPPRLANSQPSVPLEASPERQPSSSDEERTDSEIGSSPKRRRVVVKSDSDARDLSNRTPRKRVRHRSDAGDFEAVLSPAKVYTNSPKKKRPSYPRHQDDCDDDDAAPSTPRPSSQQAETQVPEGTIQHTSPQNLFSSSEEESEPAHEMPRIPVRRCKPHSDAQMVVGDDLASTAHSTDVDDLELPTPPSTPKLTPKQRTRAALEKYKNKRENRSSPRFVEGAKVGGAESPSPSDDGSPAIDSNVIESAGDAETESEQHNSFIDDSEPLADAAEELEAVLGSQRRTLEEHFAVFIEYIVRVRFEPGFAPSQEFYETAIRALRRKIDDFVNSMRLQTWNAPFIATLDLRPVLHHEFHTDDQFPDKRDLGDHDVEYGCQACWTRGDKTCDGRGQRCLWTEAGTYNRTQDTYEDISEGGIQYETKTFFKNHALALKRPYQPEFKLIIGARCCNRAAA
ncbi:hypothetical protein B0H13DRAFT_2120670 [Mycena leptocephala]|nr:hypothetical protein B0H13DRAFT_2120670 [Mycena leptocephala]